MMKIKVQTDRQMLVKSNPFFQVIIAVIILVIGIAVLVGFAKKNLEMALLFGGLLILFSVITILFTRYRTIVINKDSNSFQITVKGIIGNRNQQLNISDIDRIEISEQMMPGNMGGGPGFHTSMSTQVQYTSFIILKNGDEILLSRENPSTGGFRGLGIFLSRSRDRGTDKKIADFLNIPFVQQTMPTIGETIGNVVNAVKKPESFVSQQSQQPNPTPPVQPQAPPIPQPPEVSQPENTPNNDNPPS